MTRIWTKNISPNFILKEVLEILCLKIIIPKTGPKVPPKRVTISKIFSEILERPFLA